MLDLLMVPVSLVILALITIVGAALIVGPFIGVFVALSIMF